MAQPGRQAAAQRRPRRDGLPDRRADRLCRQRRLLLDQALEALPAEVRRGREWLPPAGFGVQAVQLRDRDRLGQAHRRHRADGRRHRLRQRLHAQRRRPPRARTAHRPKRTAVLAQHPVGQGHAGQRPGDGLPARPGVRAALPGRLEQCRPVAGARHAGNAAGRSGHRLRHDRQRRSVHRAHHDPHGQGPQRRGRRRSVRAARADTGHQPAGCLHHHEHPGRQHEPQRQPVLGQVRAARARTASAGRQRSRPARTTTPRTSTPTATSPRRPASSARTGSTRWSSERGTATATTARSARPTIRCSRSTSRPTSGRASSRRRPRTGRSATSGGRRRASSRSRSTRSPATCRSAATRARGMVHRGHRAEEPAAARSVRPRGPRPPGLRVEVRQLAGVGSRLAAARTARAAARWAVPTARASPTSTTTASTPSAASGARSWARTAPNRRRQPSCVPLPTPGCQRRDPVVRAPGAVGRCAGPCLLPARIGDAGAECAAQRGAVAATGTHARTEPTPTPEPRPDADARADPHRQPGSKAALLRPRPDRGREG